jgi:membrane protein DedA with SNARE-associated domain
MQSGLSQRIPANAILFSIAAAASALSIILILDYPELPTDTLVTATSISAVFNGLVASMSTTSYAGLFVLMFLESLSLPIPSELFLPLAGYFVFEGKMTFLLALGVSTLAGLAGSIAAYYIALALGRPLVYALARKIGVDQNSLIKSEAWLNGRGSLTILIARFVPGIRSSISLPAGALRMNMLKFSVMTAIGSFGWSAILMYIGYSAGPLWESSSMEFSKALIGAMPYVVVACSVSYMIYYAQTRFSKKKAQRQFSSYKDIP